MILLHWGENDMNSEVKNMETILPFGNTLKPLVASSNILSMSCLWQDKRTYNCSPKVHNSASSLG